MGAQATKILRADHDVKPCVRCGVTRKVNTSSGRDSSLCRDCRGVCRDIGGPTELARWTA